MKQICLAGIMLILLLGLINCSNNNNAESYFKSGFAHYKKGEIEQAINDYNKSIELNPSFADAYYNRGLLYQRKGMKEKAIADLEISVKLAPNHPSIPEVKKIIEELKQPSPK